MNTTVIAFDRKTTKLIDELKISCRASSRAETLRKALLLLDIFTKAHQQQQKLVIRSDDGVSETEIIMY